MNQRLSNLFITSLLILAVWALLTPEVYAQDAGARISGILTAILRTLRTIGITAFTIAIIFAGYKMAFQHARWSEVSHVVIGGIIVGTATTIATMLLPVEAT